ncbi:MAG: choice-of-anchor D domain-containing protein [Bacteroidota bacterium]
MKKTLLVLLLTLAVISGTTAQSLFKETFNYPNDGGLVDCSLLSATSPYFPVAIDSLGHPDWINGASAAFDGPVLIQTGALTYPGYSLSGLGKKVYLPSIITSPRQSARRAYPAQTGKVYYGMMVKLQEQYMLGTLVNGVLVDKTMQDLNGTTLACINTSTSSSGIRGLLVFVRADTIGGVNYGKYLAGVSYKRDDAATAFSLTKKLDTLQTYLMVVCTDPSTAKTSLWINPDFSAGEPVPDAVCTNVDGPEVISPIYFTLYQRSGFPSGWMGGIRLASSWSGIFGPEFSVNKNSINFDSVVVRSVKKDSIIITNNGSSALTVSSIVSSTSEFTVSPASASVAPGSQHTVFVKASLTSAVDKSGTIIITHNASAKPETVSVTVHPLVLPSTPVMSETFNYAVGGLDGGNALSPRMNVSKGLWVCGTTSAFTDSIGVEADPLVYEGYSLSGLGKKVFLPNDVAATSNDRAYRSFAPQTGKVYYSIMVNLKDVTNLSSNTSTNGEYFIGLWPSTASTNALYRGLLTIRLGSVAGTYQLGIRATQPTANSSSVWAAGDLNPSQTYLIVVSYERGSLPSASLWINPDLSGREPAPNAVSAVSVAMTDNADIGRFGIYQRGLTPHVRLGGLRVGTTWSSFLYPEMVLAKKNIDFGTVTVGVKKLDSLVISNTGTADLIFTSITSSDTAFSIISSPTVITPGTQAKLVVSAKLDTTIAKGGKIILIHNGITIGDTITVSAQPFTAPFFSVSTKNITYGMMAVGTQKSDSVIVTNTGNAPLQITAVTSSHAVFTVLPVTAVIAPAGQKTFVITAKLDSAKHRNAKIVFTHNGTISTDTVTVSLQSLTDVSERSSIPSEFALLQNYPNPFNPTTTIPFSIAQKGLVSAAVYDMLGRRITLLLHQDMEPGRYTTQWNGSEFSSGLYLCRLQSGTNISTIKIMLMK